MDLPVIPSFRNVANPKRLWGIHQDSLEFVRANPMRLIYDLNYIFLACKVPIMNWGPVGVGKTQKALDISYETDENSLPYQVILVAAGTEEPTTISGLRYTGLAADGTTVMYRSMPDIVKQVLEYATSSWHIRNQNGDIRSENTMLNRPPILGEGEQIVECTKMGGLTIMFLDEMTTCMPAQQNALLGILTHADFGGVSISEYVSFMMAANPPGTVSTVNDLSEAVMNRGGHVPWYGEQDLWFEGWSTGFGVPNREPDPWSVALVRETFKDPSAQQVAFRDESWTVEDLVPYEKIQHTPRSMDLFGKVSFHINEIWEQNQGDPAIRDYYVSQTARALLGLKWEGFVTSALERIAESISPEALISTVRRSSVTLKTSIEDFALSGMQDLHKRPDGSYFSMDQVDAALSDLIDDKIMDRGRGFSVDAYLTAWTFALAMPNAGDQAGLIGRMVKLVELFGVGVKVGALSKDSLPAFLTEDIKKQIRQQGVA